MLSCMVSCYSRKVYICQGGDASFPTTSEWKDLSHVSAYVVLAVAQTPGERSKTFQCLYMESEKARELYKVAETYLSCLNCCPLPGIR